MPHTDVGSPVWEEGCRKSPVAVDALEMQLQGVQQVWCGRSVADVVYSSQSLQLEVVPCVRSSGGWGEHDFPVPGRKGVGRGIGP